MQFIIRAYDGEGKLGRRIEVRARHFANIERISRHVICAGAIRDEAGQMIGSMLVMDFRDREELDEYLANEPYAQEHVWETIEIEQMTVAILDGKKTELWPTDVTDPA
ncbi:MAG: hypothetical protein J6Y88_05705 [Bacteroidales bacterium]|nr:hypothetical protein [Bacteroidales bacterium]